VALEFIHQRCELIYDNAHHIRVNKSIWLQDVFVGFIAGCIAIDFPKLSSASIRDIARAICTAITGDVLSIV
jgi:hypothetical protein